MKAIIPAGGLGTRFLPITKSIPKEMLPIVDKPAIQYIVEEAINSGIKEIIIVLGPGKNSIKNYFTANPKLINHLKKNGKTKEANEVEKISKMAKFSFVLQDKPLGDGHAILCAAHLIKNEPVAVLFGDDIYDSKTPPLKQMLSHYKKLSAPIIALTKVPKKETNKYGIIGYEATKASASERNKKNSLYKVSDLVEKPASPAHSPSNLAIVGKYIVTPDLIKTLAKSVPGTDGEHRLIDGMKLYIKESKIYGLEIEGKRFDTGSKEGYIKAISHFAK